jgi:hypothetical protein
MADYTILLVTVWLNIEELYHRGVVLPEQIMQGLMEKATTMRAHDCREENREHGDMCQHHNAETVLATPSLKSIK